MDSSNKILRIVALVLRVALGAVFVYAAIVKLLDKWELFALAISSYKILPLQYVELVARTLPWLELALGLMLIAGVWLRVAAPAVSLLLLGFFALMVRAYITGMQISCGCFGNDEIISWRTLLRDGTLLAGALALATMAFLHRRKAA